DLPQIWDELRRKVNDLKGALPPGVNPPLVIDDFGDVYGILLAVTGEGYSYKELNPSLIWQVSQPRKKPLPSLISSIYLSTPKKMPWRMHS
ncbi:hypothetical protein, partial [Vibrio cholerae]|uniref:hypothetical protein n=1 Tax=Vibrio cholerae TaxID=666 RepID=UPI002015F8C2